MKKRFVSMLLALSMCMGLAVPAFAAEEQPLNVVQVETDLIVNGDYEQNDSGVAVFTRVTELPMTRSTDGARQFMKEAVAVVPESQEEAMRLDNEVAEVRSKGGSESKYSNLTGGIVLYSTIYYTLEEDRTPNLDRSTISLTKVEGHWERTTQTVRVQSQTVECMQIGSGPATENSGQTKVYNPTVNNWSYTISGWNPVYNWEINTDQVGATYRVSCVANSGSTFTVKLPNLMAMPINH